LIESGNTFGVTDLGTRVPDELTVWGRAMWVWLNHPELFGKAQILYQIDQMPWWRKRNDLSHSDPDVSEDALDSLASRTSALLRAQGRGKVCTVEHMRRGDIHYFVAHPDDFVASVLVHDSTGQLSPEIFRQTLLIVFAYSQNEGSLELYAKGLSKSLKEELEAAFSEAILHQELNGFSPNAAYELNQLRDSNFNLTTDPADQIRVHVRRMRLSMPNSGRRVTIEIDNDDDIHMAINACINLDDAPLSEWNVTQVTFRFEFLPLDGRKPGSQSFDVSFPRSCSLRNARPERVELIQKYLKRWNIDLAKSAETIEPDDTTEPAALPLGA